MSAETESHTGLFPTYEKRLKEIKARLANDFKLAMLLIDTGPIRNIEYSHGKLEYDKIINTLQSILQELQSEKQIRKDDIICLNSSQGDIFYIFLSGKRQDGQFNISDYENFATRIISFINQKIFSIIFPLIKAQPRLNIGYGITFHNPSVKKSRLIQSLISDAEQMARYQEIKNKMIQKEAVYKLIVEKKITITYQPILDFLSQNIIGYEAFSHGPQDTEYENPDILFSVAREIGLVYELDWLCKIRTFIDARDFEPGKKLFVNIFSSSIAHSQTRLNYLEDLLNDTHIDSHDVIFEIADPLVLENIQFLNDITKNYGKSLNLAIKIDDSWILSDLSMIKNLRVKYIKLKKSITRNLHNNPKKKAMLHSLISIARVMRADIIAEGIKQKDELKALVTSGVIYGQGILFTKPGVPYPEVSLTKMYIEETLLKDKLLSTIYNKRGMDYFNKGLYDQSILEFTKALEIIPDEIEVIYYLAQAYYEDRAYPAALKELTRLLTLDPSYADAYFTRAMIQEKSGYPDQAIVALEKFIETAPAISQANIELATKKLEKLTRERN